MNLARPCVVPVLFGLVLPLLAQDEPVGLTARELFYRPAATAQARPVGRPKPAGPARRREPADVVVPVSNTVPTPESPRRTPPGGRVGDPGESDMPPEFVKAAYAPPSGTPLGLRYSLYRQSTSGEFEEVDADSVFRSGDMIQLRLEGNDDAHLYVLHQGSSGGWEVLFPNDEVGNGSNKVRKGESYTIPPGGGWRFDQQKGTERVIVVLTRQPEKDLDKLIYSVGKGQETPAPQPANTAPAPARPAVLMASASVDDKLLQEIRTGLVTRDLVFEKVTPQTKQTQGARPAERAAYVVNPSGKPDARLVVDLKLEHR